MDEFTKRFASRFTMNELVEIHQLFHPQLNLCDDEWRVVISYVPPLQLGSFLTLSRSSHRISSEKVHVFSPFLNQFIALHQSILNAKKELQSRLRIPIQPHLPFETRYEFNRLLQVFTNDRYCEINELVSEKGVVGMGVMSFPTLPMIRKEIIQSFSNTS